jgi:hypothetical protein
MLGILHVLAVSVGVMFALIVPSVLFAIADGARDLALSMLLVGALGRFCSVDGAGFDRRFPTATWTRFRISGAGRDVGACYR